MFELRPSYAKLRTAQASSEIKYLFSQQPVTTAIHVFLCVGELHVFYLYVYIQWVS